MHDKMLISPEQFDDPTKEEIKAYRKKLKTN